MQERTFGNWLREKRLDLGMTLIEFSEKSDISYVTLSNIENDKVKVGINALKKLATSLDMEYIELRNILKDEQEGE